MGNLILHRQNLVPGFGAWAGRIFRPWWGALLWLGLLGGSGYQALAAPLASEPGSDAAPSLATALNSDGTLRPGAQGSFDARQFVMRTATDGRPVFRLAGARQVLGPGDENWQDGFGLPGTNGTVLAVVQAGATTYVGGTFTTAGGVGANRIARWDGTSWSSLGTGPANGLSDAVYALAVVGNTVYAGGSFTRAGGSPAGGLARWDGSSWSKTGTGAGVSGGAGAVKALAVIGSTLYAGGDFSLIDGISVNGIGQWDGTRWSSLGTGSGIGVGAGGAVSALAVAGTTLYVGGSFITAGDGAANSIAKWDGTTWSPLGTGVALGSTAAVVNALAVAGTSLYVGGSFITAGGVGANSIARWDGTTWSGLGTGVALGSFGGTVRALAVAGTSLYVGGSFNKAGGVAANGVARWDGSGWNGLGPTDGVTGGVNSLAVMGSSVYAGGSFELAGGAVAKFIARWDGSGWNTLGTGNGVSGGPGGAVAALAIAGTDVYVGGQFATVGSLVVNNIAKWDGTRWSSLGTSPNNGVTGTSAQVVALAVAGNVLYVGGIFSRAGGVAANGVARWDGSGWSSLGTGFPNIFALAVLGTDLYAGGNGLRTPDGTVLNGIGRWDGTRWYGLGAGATNGTNLPVVALAVAGNVLYAGGNFSLAGGVAANGVARWDGTSWSSLGTGPANGVSGANDLVKALAGAGSILYVGGNFNLAGGVSSGGLARWDGTSWRDVGGASAVTALALAGTTLYAAASFSGPFGAINRVGRWDGTSWTGLGTGLGAPGTNSNGGFEDVFALATGPGPNLYAGGSFRGVGDFTKASSWFAVYRDPGVVTATTGGAAPARVSVYPNPAGGRAATLLLTGLAGPVSAVQAALFDPLGRLVGQRTFPATAGGVRGELPVAGLAAGTYLVRLTTQNAQGQPLSQLPSQRLSLP